MTTKHLLIFGDSWSAGTELDLSKGEKPFGNLLAESVGAEISNHSQPSTGSPHLILQLQQAIHSQKVSGSMALFCLSHVSRSIYFAHGQWQEIQVNRDDEVSRNFYKHIYSQELCDFSMNCYVLALQRMCQQHDIDDYYISCWDDLNLYLDGIDKDKFYQQGRVGMTGILGCQADHSDDVIINRQHPTIYPNNCHPNQLGHQIIADELGKWIGHR